MGIQTPWQEEMMIEHGHQGGVAVGATFGTNEEIYMIHNICACDLIH